MIEATLPRTAVGPVGRFYRLTSFTDRYRYDAFGGRDNTGAA